MGAATEHLTAALQDYLEAIYRIEGEKRVARPRDISQAVGVHKSTVTAALRSLGERGLIHYRPYEAVTLTEAGRKRAREIAARSLVIGDFLRIVLDVEPELAETNARRMLHAVDEEVLERIVCFLAFAQQQPDACPRWLEKYRCFSDEVFGKRCCEEWIERCIAKSGAERAPDKPGR